MTGQHQQDDDGDADEVSGRLMAIERTSAGPVYVVETTSGRRIRIALPGLPDPEWPPPLEHKDDALNAPPRPVTGGMSTAHSSHPAG